MQRKRRPIQEGEFSDPLKNYDKPDYADEVEQSLCEHGISEMPTKPLITIAPTTTVRQAIKLMAEKDVACLLVAQDGKLQGVFTERDVLDRVSEQFAQMADQPVSQVMTTSPIVAYVTEAPAKALNLMAVGGFRHVPILDVDDNIVGVLGPRRVTAYLQKLFESSEAGK